MPALDVSAAVIDPIINQKFTLIRTSVSYDLITGRPIRVINNIIAYGVIMEGQFDPLERTAQYEVSKDTIKVITTTPMYMVNKQTAGGITTHYEPDKVFWQNSTYVMIKVWDYGSYGRGYYAGTFEIIDAEGAQ